MTTTGSLSEHWVDLSHGRTRFLRKGSGAPVLFLHGVGFTDGAEVWSRSLEHMAASHDAIAVDLIGWGDGDRLDTCYSFAYLVDFVREFQDALGLSRCHIVGHSMGGWVASLLAYESPDRVDRLVLVSSGGTVTRPLATMTAFQPPASAEEVYVDLVERRGYPAGMSTRALADRQFGRAGKQGALESYRRILGHMTDPVHRARYNTVRRLARIAASTLVVWGRHDEVNPLDMGRRTADLIPDAQLTVLECGHFPASQTPGPFHHAVFSFLSS